MSDKAPNVRRVSWRAMLLHVTLIVVLMLASAVVFGEESLAAATVVIAGAFVVCLFASQWALAGRHRLGVRRVREGRFEEAIEQFEASYAFFTRHGWVDTYRYLTLMSMSALSYREMALVNIAYCHGRLGHAEKTKEYYLRALAQFPQSAIAKACLTLIAAFEKRAASAQRKDIAPDNGAADAAGD